MTPHVLEEEKSEAEKANGQDHQNGVRAAGAPMLAGFFRVHAQIDDRRLERLFFQTAHIWDERLDISVSESLDRLHRRLAGLVLESLLDRFGRLLIRETRL